MTSPATAATMAGFMRRFVPLAVLLVFGLVLGLGAAEIGVRLMAGRERPHGHMESDPVLHHRLRRSITTTVGGVPFTTNALGLRDREIGPKTPDVFRVLMIGDSFTEGGGLAIEDTVAKRVESALDARGCDGRRIEVINAGTGSWSPILEYLYLTREGFALDPDLVVLNFDMTDVHDDWVRTQTARLDAQGLPLAVPSDTRAEAAILMPPLPLPPSLGFLRPVERAVDRLALWQAFRRSRTGRDLFGGLRLDVDRLERLGLVGDIRYDIFAIVRDDDSPSQREAWRLTERYLTGIARATRERHVPFALVVYPHAYQVAADASPGGRAMFGLRPGLYDSSRPFDMLHAIGARAGFAVLDLRAIFRERAATGGPLFREDDIHHTARGAAVFAEGIQDGLLRHALLPCL